MAGTSEIEHSGRVDTISGNRVKVNFIAESACASCHAKGYCSVSEVKEKSVEVPYPGGMSLKEGEQVQIVLAQTLGFKALFLGYILPLILIIAALIVFTTLFKEEGKAGLLSLLVVAVYYFILYLFRKSIGRQFKFSIRKSD